MDGSCRKNWRNYWGKKFYRVNHFSIYIYTESMIIYRYETCFDYDLPMKQLQTIQGTHPSALFAEKLQGGVWVKAVKGMGIVKL